MTTDEAKRARWCPSCRWVTADDADGSLTPARAARKYPCEACLFGLNGDGWSSPESDPQALRYELDGCRAEIERLRAVIGAMKVEIRHRFHRRSEPPEGWRRCQNFTIDEQTGLLHEMFTNAPPDKAPHRPEYDVVWIVSDPFTQRRLVEDWTPAEPPPFVDEAVPASSPVLGESGEGT